MGVEDSEHRKQLDVVREAFEREFERFARFHSEGAGAAVTEDGSTDAILRDLSGVRTLHTGRKSALANLKKMIGRVPADERAVFGQTCSISSRNRRED